MKKIYIFICLMLIAMGIVGCGSKLSTEEQIFHDLAKTHGSASSKVELDQIIAFNIKPGVYDDIDTEYVSAGQYIFLTGKVLWDNGAKDDLYVRYFTSAKDGEQKETDLNSYTTASDSLGQSWNKLQIQMVKIQLLYYQYLLEQGDLITYEQFQNGDIGVLSMNQESIDKINEELKK